MFTAVDVHEKNRFKMIFLYEYHYVYKWKRFSTTLSKKWFLDMIHWKKIEFKNKYPIYIYERNYPSIEKNGIKIGTKTTHPLHADRPWWISLRTTDELLLFQLWVSEVKSHNLTLSVADVGCKTMHTAIVGHARRMLLYSRGYFYIWY